MSLTGGDLEWRVSARTTKGGRRVARGATSRRKKSRPRKKAAVRKSAGPKARKLTPLGALRAKESKEILLSLLRCHPELRPEADALAKVAIETVDAKVLGLTLGRRLVELDIFDVGDSSPRDGRYVAIWEAAQETLDALLEPYLADLQRCVELGLEEAAQATCLGIVLGLYRARNHEGDDSLLAYAPDFCANEADHVVSHLAKQSGRLQRRRWTLPEESQRQLADWPGLFPRGVRRKKQR